MHVYEKHGLKMDVINRAKRDVSKRLSGTIYTSFYHLTSIIGTVKDYGATNLCRPMLGEASFANAMQLDIAWQIMLAGICYASNAQYFHNYYAGQKCLLCSTICQ